MILSETGFHPRIKSEGGHFRDHALRLAEQDMIIESEKDITPAVLSELARAKNPRLREIMSAFVRHLHEFAREVKLTEEEFQAAIGYIVALGRHTNETHNEAVLMSGSLGFSSLICLLNNGSRGSTGTYANLAR